MDNQKEPNEFNRWTKHNPDIPESELHRLWQLSKPYKSGYQPDVESGLSKLKLRMAQSDQGRVIPIANSRRKWLSVAAAILLLLVAGITLQVLLEEDSQTIVNLQNTPKEVVLDDGSMVVLNKDSRLEYPKNFQGQLKREVRLFGEAYFKVQPNPAQPFIILTEKAEIKVLGTSFNVRAYDNESTTEVEVESGHVMLMVKNAKNQFDLKAKEKAIFQHEMKEVKKVKVNVLNGQAWRTNSLQFRKTPLKEVLEAVSRYYWVDVSLEDETLEHCQFNSDFEDESLSVVLDAIKGAFNAEVVETSANKAYILRGGACN
ncbi:MAG: iron dicitrate transporter FecR [Saprospiraceae bacterium]|nr:MAG: iron dicitrate transporter FecR [Saprospiraceae bacterium]